MTHMLTCVIPCVCVCVSAAPRGSELPNPSNIIGCYSYLSSWDKGRLLAFCPNKEAPDWVSGRINPPITAPGLAEHPEPPSVALDSCDMGFSMAVLPLILEFGEACGQYDEDFYD